ncbi:MAG: bifunctional adenosylcobinamide kinase/adenosylcobinamide-phosphate guanylyltransferase, partial [Pygmaiobacter sp.]
AALHLGEEEFAAQAVCDVQLLAANGQDLRALAERLAQKPIVIATEIGGGIVPVNADERAAREAAGQLAQLLAERAEVVLRICCGLPQVLKGTWQC